MWRGTKDPDSNYNYGALKCAISYWLTKLVRYTYYSEKILCQYFNITRIQNKNDYMSSSSVQVVP